MSVDLSFFRSESSQRLRAEGRVEGVCESILRVLQRRGIGVSAAARERLEACDDRDTLYHWLDRALIVDNTDELFRT